MSDVGQGEALIIALELTGMLSRDFVRNPCRAEHAPSSARVAAAAPSFWQRTGSHV